MGGPSYQTPYPVDDTKGGKVIWNWGTKSWSPYTPPKPGADTPPAAGTPDASGEGRGGAPDAASTAGADRMGGGDKDAPGGLGPGMPQQKKGTRRVAPRRSSSMSLPGASLLMDESY